MTDPFEVFKAKVEETLPKEEPVIEERKPDPIPEGTELVSLNGLVYKDGSVSKTQFFDFLSEIDKSRGDILLTKEEANKLRLTYMGIKVGINAVAPLICAGTKCPFKDECPLYDMKKEPIGKRCPIESEFLSDATRSLMKEFEVDTEDYSELMLVQELAELMLYERRATMILARADNAELFINDVTYDKQGNEILTQKIHWAVDIKEKYKNRRLKILDALNATRKQRANTEAPKDDYTSEIRKAVELINKYNNAIDANYETT